MKSFCTFSKLFGIIERQRVKKLKEKQFQLLILSLPEQTDGLKMAIQDGAKELDVDTRKNLIRKYQPDAKRLVRYASWLETKRGSDVMNSYTGDGVQKAAFTFPVYDSTLLGFVKTAKETQFITRNYQYVYNRNRIKNVEQEKRAVRSATLRNMELLSGILSRYILGGMTKSVLWAQGVENGIFLEILNRLRELLEINDLS